MVRGLWVLILLISVPEKFGVKRDLFA